ncbi:hypothetical protein [Turicibacter sanguinis]|uniref:hypothetical protein n=1 Tax=Turicibacter sanguinis TaxID=154288 RepID=UPI0018ABFA27|nr:hypothetical protein [Turicibacter sanguinis]MDB8551804.1 hypothetical protein [Turicibacter sanguinis]
MRNKPLITIIILTAIGIFIGFNFQTPGMKQYNQLNKIDESIQTALVHEDTTLTKRLDTFYQTVNTIIEQATTSENQDQISFESYESEFAILSRMNQNLAEVLKASLNKLPNNDLGHLEKERLTSLEALTQAIETLIKDLSNLEEIVHTAKPVQARDYVLNIQENFNNIQVLQHRYIDQYQAYLTAKTDFYQSLK